VRGGQQRKRDVEAQAVEAAAVAAVAAVAAEQADKQPKKKKKGKGMGKKAKKKGGGSGKKLKKGKKVSKKKLKERPPTPEPIYSAEEEREAWDIFEGRSSLSADYAPTAKAEPYKSSLEPACRTRPALTVAAIAALQQAELVIDIWGVQPQPDAGAFELVAVQV